MNQPVGLRCLGLLVALAISAVMTAGAISVGAGIWDEQAEVEEVETLVSRIAAESAAVTDSYFSAAETSADLAAGAFAMKLPAGADPTDALLGAMAELATSQSNIAAAFVGYPDGRFLLARRSYDTDTEVVLKRVDVQPKRMVTETLVHLDDLAPISATELTDDLYDPRSRPWFADVAVAQLDPGELDDHSMAGPGVLEGTSSWSDPYEFFSSKRPGITYSRSFYDLSGQLIGAVGIDIELADLEAFLDERRPTENSRAIVTNENGTEIARSRRQTRPDLSASGSVAVARESVTRSKMWSLTVEAAHDDFLTTFREQRARYEAVTIAIAAVLSVFLMTGSVAFTNHLTRLRMGATTDPLTGLLNRRAILAHLDAALERQPASGVVGLMIIDLDAFKVVNDTYGHAVGDAALSEIASRADGVGDPNAIVARLGGDEFCVVYVDHDDGAGERFREYSRRLMRAVFSQPLVPGTHTTSDGSGGFTMHPAPFRPTTDTVGLGLKKITTADMFIEADIALYAAKRRSTRSTAVEYEPSMEIPAIRDTQRKEELALAIDDGQFSWHFQPEVDLRTNQLVGAESLLRWNHPDRGKVCAEEFINDVERFGLLPELLPAMIEAAVGFLTPYSDLGFTMRLNLAEEQLHQQEVAELLAQATERFPTTNFCVEITERAFLEADGQIAVALEKLRQLGVSIVLDDFGTGFSSLKELHDLPVDGIKIDKAFVAALDGTDPRKSIVAMMIDLGALMGLEVVAEGVENAAQAEALRRLGCTRGQGYLFGAAQPASEFWSEQFEAQIQTVLPMQQTLPTQLSLLAEPALPMHQPLPT